MNCRVRRSDFESRLREAQTLRNWIVHHYFWERAAAFVTPDGRLKMLTELDEMSDKLHELDEYFDSIVVQGGSDTESCAKRSNAT